MIGFGGVLPVARQVLVDRRGWLTNETFAEVLSVAMFLPGGSIINVAVIIGHRFRGWRGSVASVLGLFSVPFVLMVTLTMLFQRFGSVDIVRGILLGVAPAAAGLLLGSSATLATPLIRTHPAGTAPFIVVAFIAVAVLRVPLLLVLLILAPLSVAVSWRVKT